MKRLKLILFLFVLGSLVFAAGEQEVQTITTKTVTDSLGRNVEIPVNPERIIVGGRGTIMITDPLYAFDNVSDKIAAVSKTNQGMGDFLEVVEKNFTSKIRLESVFSPEHILEYNPDLVLLKSYMKQKMGDAIEACGIPVIYLDFEKPETYIKDIRVIGEILNQQDRANELVEYYVDALNDVMKKKSVANFKCLFLYHSTKGGQVTFNVPPMDWIQSQMITQAGGLPVWSDAVNSKGWNSVSMGQIAKWDPDCIFFVDYKRSAVELIEELKQNEIWAELKATKNNALYPIPADYYSWGQPNTRWILSLKWMASILNGTIRGHNYSEFYPEVIDFFTQIYNLPINEIDKILQRLN